MAPAYEGSPVARARETSCHCGVLGVLVTLFASKACASLVRHYMVFCICVWQLQGVDACVHVQCPDEVSQHEKCKSMGGCKCSETCCAALPCIMATLLPQSICRQIHQSPRMATLRWMTSSCCDGRPVNNTPWTIAAYPECASHRASSARASNPPVIVGAQCRRCVGECSCSLQP